MTESEHSPGSTRRSELLALAGELRPELHRYCARLMGSVIDGEDVVQDTLARAFVALDGLSEVPPLRAWLFRIAHNRALDLLRSRAIRTAEPIEAAHNVADQATPDPAWREVARVFARSMRRPASFLTQSQRPPRWRAMWLCSTSGTGMACARSWRTM